MSLSLPAWLAPMPLAVILDGDSIKGISMANRNFPSQRQFSFHFLPVKLDFSMSVTGSSGVLGATANPGQGITSITRLGAGVYRLQLNDNYASFLDATFSVQSNVTGSNVASTALVTDTIYSITALGTTTQAAWVTCGLPSGITAQVGSIFLCAATAAGTGTAKAIAANTIYDVQIVGNPNLMLSNQPFNAGSGGYITFQCIAPAGAATATATATDPAAGSVITGSIFLNNSAVQ